MPHKLHGNGFVEISDCEAGCERVGYSEPGRLVAIVGWKLFLAAKDFAQSKNRVEGWSGGVKWAGVTEMAQEEWGSVCPSTSTTRPSHVAGRRQNGEFGSATVRNDMSLSEIELI